MRLAIFVFPLLKLVAHHTVHVEISHVAHVVVVHGSLLCLLLFHVLVIHLLFSVLLLEESFFSILLSFFFAISDDNVIKKCSGSDLPDFETNVCASIFAHLVHLVIILVLRIVDHRMNPLALVFRVVNHLGLPFALVVRIVDHGCFPLTVVFIVPVFGFLGIWVGDFCWNVVPSFGLLVFRVGDLGLVNPVSRFAGIRVLDLLGRQKVKFLVQCSFSHRLVVDLDLESVVGVQD
mmetsp:Transcript_27575/g.45593  ORF Transcript_27575/g.45593 Transcript_27575/m.45593 type:complete len:234 (-) Transcript_27575:462-1163(-)